MHKKVSILRDFHSFTVGLTDVEIAPPNDRRIAMIISPPPLVIGTGVPTTVQQFNIAINALGNKATLNIPAGVNSRLDYAGLAYEAGGSTGTFQLLLTRGGTTTILQNLVGAGAFTAGMDLLGGDTLNINVSVVGIGTADFYMSATPLATNARVTLTYQNPPTLDAGINLYAGQQQYILDAKLIGQGIREDIHAVANVAGTIIGVMDIFTDCPCMLSEIQW